MDVAPTLLAQIRRLLNARQYRVRIHAVRHMVEEGFSEENMLEAINGKSRILEHYSDEARCLVYGTFSLGANVQSPLHVICDYSHEEIVDIITAYIPQQPWWSNPTKRGRTL